jgi:hypothetical protein
MELPNTTWYRDKLVSYSLTGPYDRRITPRTSSRSHPSHTASPTTIRSLARSKPSRNVGVSFRLPRSRGGTPCNASAAGPHSTTGVTGRAATVRTDRLPSVFGQRSRRKTFSTPRCNIRITLARLSERAAADSRKCCAMATCDRNRPRPCCQNRPEVQAK